MKRILLCFVLITLTLISCTTEKRVKIDTIDEYLEELSDNCDGVNSIRVTYIAYIIIFNVDINEDSIDFVEDELLVDLQTFLNNKDNQSIIREYFHEKHDKEKLNPTFPELHIFFTSYNDQTAKYDVIFHAPLENFPTGDELKDTEQMNRAIEKVIDVNRSQYMWSLKLLKTRPEVGLDIYK